MLPSISNLNLAFNNISKLTGNPRDCARLSLNLSSNVLTSFRGLQNFDKNLDVSFNKVVSLADIPANFFSEMGSVNVQGNPIVCNC